MMVSEARPRIWKRLVRSGGVLLAGILLTFMEKIRKIHIFGRTTVSQCTPGQEQESDGPEVDGCWSAGKGNI